MKQVIHTYRSDSQFMTYITSWWKNSKKNLKLNYYNCIVPLGFFPWEIQVTVHRESQLRQSCTIQPTEHAGCFSVSITHQTLTWTTGSLRCKQVLMHASAQDNIRESKLKINSGREIPCCTRELNLNWQCAGPMLYQLSYIPIQNDPN